jgi:hypothetical protein
LRATSTLFALFTLLLCSCPAQRTSAPFARVATKPPAAAILPRGWPLDFLTLPPGAELAQLDPPAPAGYGDEFRVSCLPFNVGTSEEGCLWRVGFNYGAGTSPADYDQAVEYVVKAVTPLGYYLYFDEDNEQRRGREYISPDGKYVVQLYHFKLTDSYHLQVSEYAKPWHETKAQPKNG